MGLLDKLFGRQSKPKTVDKDLPSFWEDDYCQVEIVPRKNIDHIKDSIIQIEQFAEKTRTEYGFTDIFMREGLPFPLLNEEIRVDYFEKQLNDKGFEKARQIRYDGNTIIDCSPKTTNAFLLPCSSFFYDCKDELINNIWISTSLITSTDHFNKILETLYQLGESCELVLVDWNSSDLVDLSNRDQITQYLMGYWK
jgi:hypothetical protein